jgi:hypothetical protein
VRKTVRSAFTRLGVQPDPIISEHVLIRDDFYCGRRFHSEGLNATWFIEEDEIKISGRDGSVIEVLCASQQIESESSGDRKAA